MTEKFNYIHHDDLIELYRRLGLFETADLVDILESGISAFDCLWVNCDGTVKKELIGSINRI